MADTPARLKVLVVDDEPRSSTPWPPRCATRASRCARRRSAGPRWPRSSSSPPDLIVLDVMLPDLDGLEVTRRLRSDGVRTPVLFLTASDARRGQGERPHASAATTT